MEVTQQTNPNKLTKDEASTELNDLYNRILTETKTRVFILMLLTLSEPLMATSRYPFLFLFVQSFDDNITTAQVSIMIFVVSIVASITNATITPCGDRFGHDKVYIFCVLATFIGLSIEAVSTSFGVFFVGHIVNRVPNREITFAYLASVLPHKFAVKYCSILYSLLSVIYLLGPIIGALIAQFFGYRAIFIFNAVFHFFLLFVSFLCLNNSIKYLEHKQNLCGIQKDLHKDEQFPICLRKADKSGTTEASSTVADKNESNVLVENVLFWRSLPVYDLWMLLCSMSINNLIWCNEAVIIYYFVLYFIYVYDASILYGTFMLVELVVIYGVTTLLVPQLVKRIIPSYIWLMTVWSAVFAFVGVLCIVFDEVLEMHWLFNVGIAIPFGIVGMASEMCILEIQPKEHAGKVFGMKSGLRDLARSFALVLVGLFWIEPYNALWVGLALISTLACLLSVVMMIMVKCKQVASQSDANECNVEKNETVR